MTEYGVRRLVVINSGKYLFAEIDLTKPIHLAAPNNRGKSTLVNALQFLYIDEFEKMKFGPRTHEDTRKHYFGEDRSYLVFECSTPSGIQCLLVRGLGNLRTGHFDRYIYDGEFRQIDYVDDTEIQAFDSVRAGLADRHFARIKNTELWQVLSGNVHSSNGRDAPHLGILPIRRRDEYLAFRDVFVKLLSLANVEARSLKQLVIESHAREVAERKIDVTAEYQAEFQRAERSEAELQFVRAVTSEIEAGCHLRIELRALNDGLLAATPSIWSDAQRSQKWLDQERTRLENALKGVASDRETLEARREGFDEQRIDRSANLKLIEKERSDLQASHEQWSVYSSQLIKEMRANADRKRAAIAELERHLQQAETLSPETMQRSIEDLARKIAADRQAYEHFGRTAAAMLRQAGLSESDLYSAFRIANPDLLKLVVGETVTIKDLQGTIVRIRSVASNVREGKYSDDLFAADLAHVAWPASGLFGDADQLRAQIAADEEELKQRSALWRVAEDLSGSRTTLARLKGEYEKLQDGLAQYDRYISAWHSRRHLEKCLAAARKAVEEVKSEVLQCDMGLQSLPAREQGVHSELNAVSKSQTILQTRMDEFRIALDRHALEAYLSGGGDDHDSTGEELSQQFVQSIITKLSDSISDLQAIDNVRERLRGLQTVIATKSRDFEAQQRYFSDEEEEWRLLSEAYDSLPALEEATKRNWDALITTLSARLNAIVIAVNSIKVAVERINRGLGTYQVSNLRSVQIKLEEAHDVYPAVEVLSNRGSLFQDRDSMDLAKQTLRNMIHRNETIELESLFELRIHIQQMDGTLHEAPSLDEIGSTGTSMTVKAMLFIQLVRAVAPNEKYRLHFYIDGLGELDDKNLAATAEMAVSKGILPITADPRLHLEPLAHPEVTAYSLGQSADGHFFVDSYKTYHARRRSTQREASRD